ncbi:MAG: efflux RND transporter periplasmic adaptor subunit [Beijerinckiaceae bacterium]|nr:efflux RND transporter periplasmic adaptor subunit [Beijerinckiaceae bacterium]
MAAIVAIFLIVVSGASVFATLTWLDVGGDKATASVTTDATTAGYRSAPLERGDLVSAVAATGHLAPVATVLVSSQVSGQIKELHADFNSPVTKGQVIALIDPSSFQNAVDLATADVSMARASREKATVVLREAESDLQRKRGLAQTGAGSIVERTKAEAARDLAEAAAKEAEAALQRSAAALRQVQLDLERTRIRSPVDGMVIGRNIEAGQTVAASLQAPTLFSIAQDLRDMQVNAAVDEAEIGKIVPGQRVEFTVDAHPGRRFGGAVHQIRKAPQTVQNVVTYTVVVRAPNPDLMLMPGMTASARFIVAERKDVLKAPTAALRFRPSGPRLPAGEGRVWVSDGASIKAIPVKVGLSDGTRTEVSAEELGKFNRVVIGVEAPKQTRSATKRLIGVM